jgi:antitoxin component YwqK of YwqJK toxin-antitoxin module
VPPQPSFLDTAEVSTEELDILIQQKLKERDNELTEIQKLYNPDDKIESVKLIKISDVLADLNVFNDDDDDLIVNEVSKQKVSIGNTIVYNYNQNDPPQQLNTGVNMNDKIEKIITTLTTIIEHMNIIDKKLDSLVVSIESFIK